MRNKNYGTCPYQGCVLRNLPPKYHQLILHTLYLLRPNNRVPFGQGCRGGGYRDSAPLVKIVRAFFWGGSAFFYQIFFGLEMFSAMRLSKEKKGKVASNQQKKNATALGWLSSSFKAPFTLYRFHTKTVWKCYVLAYRLP